MTKAIPGRTAYALWVLRSNGTLSSAQHFVPLTLDTPDEMSGAQQAWLPGYLQKSPVCWRQLNCCKVLGTRGVPSDWRTVSRNASGAMAPPRGSLIAGHMIHGKPCEPSSGRVRTTTSPFFSKSSTSIAFLIIGVPSKSVPFFAAKAARVSRPFAVLKAAEV